MFKLLPIIYVLISISINANAQNLVPNGSFEDYSECPNYWSYFDGYINNWFNPSDSLPLIPTPDAYNACANPSNWGVPVNICGTLAAKDGNGYAGIFLYTVHLEFECSTREYIGVKLTNPLKRDSLYSFKMYVSLAQRGTGTALSNIAAVLSKDSIKQYIACPLPMPDSAIILRNHPDSIIYNRGYWKELSFNFKANGQEQFLYIGNIDDDSELDSLNYPSTPLGYINESYYLIDDVSLTRIESVGINETLEGKIFIYPNPVIDKLTINTGQLNNITFQLFDISGRQLMQQKIENSSQIMDLSDYSNGMYVAVISSNNQVVKREKIIISR